MVSNFLASILAVFSPTFGIPNAKINFSSDVDLLFSIAFKMFLTLFSTNPYNSIKSFLWLDNLNMSTKLFIKCIL